MSSDKDGASKDGTDGEGTGKKAGSADAESAGFAAIDPEQVSLDQQELYAAQNRYKTNKGIRSTLGCVRNIVLALIAGIAIGMPLKDPAYELYLRAGEQAEKAYSAARYAFVDAFTTDPREESITFRDKLVEYNPVIKEYVPALVEANRQIVTSVGSSGDSKSLEQMAENAFSAMPEDMQKEYITRKAQELKVLAAGQ